MTKYLIVYKRDNDICKITLIAETASEAKRIALSYMESAKQNPYNQSYSLVDVVELSEKRTLEADWRDEYV